MSPEMVNSSTASNQTLVDVSIYASALNSSAKALAGTAIEETKRQMAMRTEWTGLGVEWLRSLLGKREWKLPCVEVNIRL